MGLVCLKLRTAELLSLAQIVCLSNVLMGHASETKKIVCHLFHVNEVNICVLTALVNLLEKIVRNP